MPGAVFKETLRRSWRGMLLWSIGLMLIAVSQVVTLPDVSALKDYAKVIETLPPVFIQAIGGGDAAFFATPAGYLVSNYYGIALLFYAIYSVVVGLGITTAEEDRGIMDVVLGLPIPRWRLVLERLLAYALLIVCIVAITFVGMWASLLVTPALQIGTQRLLEATFNLLPGMLLVLAVTVLLGTALRSRGRAVALAVVFLVGSYFVDFLGAAASGSLAGTLRILSFYRYYDSTAVMQNGLEWGNILVLLVVTVICAVGSLWFFQRRDISVG
jgi:beta-exotoxin I transport system permease protein